jgi:hypothetical protein
MARLLGLTVAAVAALGAAVNVDESDQEYAWNKAWPPRPPDPPATASGKHPRCGPSDP